MADRNQEPTRSQLDAILDLEGNLFLAAGAGSGKTGVVTRRFVHAIATGEARVDEILTITFTNKAAGVMMTRIRDFLRHPGKTGIDYSEEQREHMSAASREIERAQISTIDSFCSRFLRGNALAAGIDPDFDTADETQEALLKEEAYRVALERLVEKNGIEAVNLVSAYDDSYQGGLFGLVNNLFSSLRSRGLEPALPQPAGDTAAAAAAAAEKELIGAMTDTRAAVAAAYGEKPIQTSTKLLEVIDGLTLALGEKDPAARLQLVADARPGGNLGKIKDELSRLKEAREAYLVALRSQAAAQVRTVPLLDELIKNFAAAYESRKAVHGMLDFTDLETKTRDLLRDNESVRRRVSSRFRLVMVDEFQDINHLQYEIITMLTKDRDNLMMVGDENQSIYGFRDAEVELFRREDRRAAATGCRRTLSENFRSQPEILAFVNHVFNRKDMLASGSYLELEARAEVDGRKEDFRVELQLVAKKGDAGDGRKLGAGDFRKIEAERIAARLDELFRGGDYRAGDAAILLRTGTGAEVYRDALTRHGIRSYLSAGREYFGKLELGDVFGLLELLVNPHDDMALLVVLRSPMVGVTGDTLYRLGEAAHPEGSEGKPFWEIVSGDGLPAGISPADREKLTLFAGNFRRLRRTARRRPLAATVRRAIDFNDYAAITATGGKQSLANLYKLLDMAVDFEAAWGNNLAVFTELLGYLKKEKPKEAEAPVEEEGVDAVRIMTMHKAKGLEFPLVVLPRLGPDGGSGKTPRVLLDRDDPEALGLNYRGVATTTGPAYSYRELAEKRKQRELEEEKRLNYVAMTRAGRHLIISGVTKLDKPPGDAFNGQSPLEWIRDVFRLDRESRAGMEAAAGEEGHFVLEGVAGAPVGVSICSDPFAALDAIGQRRGQGVEQEVEPVSAARLKALPPPREVPPVVSPTALDTLRACQRRYYLENVLRARSILKETRHLPAAAPAGGLDASQMGTLVHAFLEKVGLPMSGLPADGQLEETAALVLAADAVLTDEDRERARGLIGNFNEAPVASQLLAAAAAGNLEREQAFSFLLGDTLVAGKIDAIAIHNGASLVVDYKTGDLSGQSPEAAAERYACQLAAYALAAGRMKPGYPVEVALVFLSHPGNEYRQRFEAADMDRLEAMLAGTITGMEDGNFEPLDSLDEHQCYACPGGPSNARLCPVGK